MNSILLLVSAAVTLAAGCYSYIYLPIQMRRAYRQSLLTLAKAVETKDTRAEGHGERVARYAVRVAKEMRLSPRQIRDIEHASFLQDVGNVRIPHAVLNETKPLTQEEMALLKAHAVIGAETIEQVEFLREISPMIRHHHEAWDGTGYPSGLRGEDIPLGARIIAVCTAYDAMVNERPYRSARDEDEAINQIRAGSGTKYDPTIVDAFLHALKKWHRGRARA